MTSTPRIKAKAFGDKFALVIEALTETEKSDSTLNHIVVIELAQANSDKTYDWKNKISFKLQAHELPLLAGLFLGFLPSYRLTRPENKSIQFDRQSSIDPSKAGHYYVKAFQERKQYSLPVLAGHGAKMAMLILHVLAQHDEGVFDDGFVLAAIRSACKLYHPITVQG